MQRPSLQKRGSEVGWNFLPIFQVRRLVTGDVPIACLVRAWIRADGSPEISMQDMQMTEAEQTAYVQQRQPRSDLGRGRTVARCMRMQRNPGAR